MMHTFLLFSRRTCGCQDLRLICPGAPALKLSTRLIALRSSGTTQILVLVQTEVDNSNMSYYDESDMLAKTTLFDQRVRTLYDFIFSPRNFISFNPQGRLVALASFGNLWLQFPLTAILSPLLRMDNGIKVWHCTDGIMHVLLVEELYQVSWRFAPLDQASQPSISVPTAKPVTSKLAGAYKSPGARVFAILVFVECEDVALAITE
ncbi:hypothetical protein BDR04DRAFT_1121217 [Suillus decipiens]|nr:hypothetical protein BDR04DRAFT_1121217 [Suillus decipiens]